MEIRPLPEDVLKQRGVSYDNDEWGWKHFCHTQEVGKMPEETTTAVSCFKLMSNRQPPTSELHLLNTEFILTADLSSYDNLIT